MSKISRGIGIASHDQKFSPNLNSFLCILQSYVFASKLWHHHMGPTYKSYLEKLASLKNKTIRVVGGADWNENFSALYYII